MVYNGEAGSKTGKKGTDRGIDGVITFIDDATRKPKRVLVQVKSGHVRAGDIRDLRGTIEREGAAIGVFITLEPPSRDMLTEAAAALDRLARKASAPGAGGVVGAAVT